MKSKALAILLLLVGPAWADVKAVIDGPETAAAGDLVVLSAEAAIGDGLKWLPPAGIQTLTCAERELAFAIGRPGKYVFGLIVADTTAAIDYVEHVVTIGGQVDEPPEEPTPGRFDALLRLSAERSAALGDPVTATRLSAAIAAAAEGIRQLCDAGQCPTMAKAKAMAVDEIEATLATRTGDALRVDWLNGWRRQINAALLQLNLVDVKNYAAALTAVSIGLRGQ